MKQDMSTTYGIKKQVTRLMAGSSHTLSLLMSMLRVSLEAAWSMARVWLKPRVAISLLLLFIVGSGNVWGQIVGDGVYYIQNNATNNGYLWPSVTTNATTGYRYITTSLTTSVEAVNNNGVSYPAHDKSYSHWVVKNVTGGYIQLINPRLNKYVVIRQFPKSNNTKVDTYGDRDVWLTDEPTAENIEYTYFVLNNDNSPYKISPKAGLNGVNTTSGYSFNSAAGNDRQWLTWSKSDDKPQNSEGRDGLIQCYSGGTPAWTFTSDLLDAPIISDVVENSTVTVADDNGLPDGYNIRYTTDGSIPTASSPIMEGKSYTVTSSVTLKAIVERYGVVLTKVAEKAVTPASCATPVITYDYTTSKVSINCATPSSTIYYTIDGSNPTASSTPYSESFSVNSPTTIKAIATHTIYPTSDVAELALTQVETPTIQNNGSNAISITTTTPDATIYYTTDGSDPTTSSAVYSSPLTDNVSKVNIKAIAVKDNMITSAVGNGVVMLKCAKPVITRNGLTFTLSCSMPTNADLYYTLEGGSETPYTGPVAFTPDQLPTTVTAVARHSNYIESEEASMELKNGSGTPDDPYMIYGSTDFTNFVSNVNSGATASASYKLGSDVSASGTDAITTAFTGSFDGGGYTISGLSHPLFNIIVGGVVKNVMLKNVHINQSGNVGAITGEAKGYTRIYNCGILPNDNTFSNRVRHSSVASTDAYCGGLVGWLKDDSRVINCFSFANVNGGTVVAGIVGYNNFASTAKETGGKYTELKTAIVNCMFYGNITGGSTKYPVYGGEKILNNTATGINNYDFYRAEANLGLADNSHYNCSWPAKEEYLTKYEYYRYLLNSNRELCGWWVGAPSAPSGMSTTEVQAVPKDASLMAKWVLDPSIAPYPILKAPGKYYSVINQDPDNRINPVSKAWESRPTSSNTIMTKAAPDTEGQKLGSITVNINKGGGLSGSDSKNIPITAMDIENNDFCYGKIQLPYYNSIFGDPAIKIDADTPEERATQWASRYGGNYGDKVVVGWEISAVEGGVAGITNNEDKGHKFTEDWQDGYNFADRYCTTKDENRTFAQGGYYYVPNGVTGITITAKWADATYLDNSANNSYDRVYMSNANAGTDFAPAGHRPTTLGNGKTVQTGTISSKIQDGDVYEKAIVLVGNHQYRVGGADIGNAGKGCTIISADFNLDDEPDYCLVWQLGTGTNRQSICPIRFDFLPVIEMGMAMKEDGSTQYYSLGCYLPLGHFEVTETTLIHFGQFEFGKKNRTKDAPLILNGGIYDQYCKGTKAQETAEDHIDYVILGGNVYMPSFSPGAHVNKGAKYPTRHCAVNVLGGRINNLYLTGNFNNEITPNTDNPHCYIDGGNFKQIAAAAKEGINGDVYFKINHSVIEEFYGGSTLADKLVTGNINVTVDNSKITKYCGGPKFGNMTLDAVNPENNKTVITNATGTTFGVYYGGGNGGTSYVQYASTDYTNANATGDYDWDASDRGNLGGYIPNTYRSGGKNYIADYEMEIVNSSTGTDAKKGIFRTYLYAAQFSATNTGPITNNLTNCKVLTSFYGGGNLGGVIGDVESTLTDTEVMGSAFGAGYSASVPEVTIYNKDKTEPTLNVYTGIITPTPDPDTKSTHETYTWCYKSKTTNVVIPSGVVIPDGVGTGNPTFEYGGKKYFYTEESLENLGTVKGKVTLKIEGTTTVKHSAYGGGEESGVDGNTEVKVTGGTIGTENLGGAEYGNVFGGGKGKEDDVNAGLVKGNTNITISGTADATKIIHNVYGGGAFGSVGTFTYDGTTGLPNGLTANTGTANITITGGTFGSDGKENGMVFGSSRGLEGDPAANANIDKIAWVGNTNVIIGTQNAESNTNPWIKGSVYGGGENGHNYQNGHVTVHSGTIGITDSGVDGGARYSTRGNVYGGGCGTDTFDRGEGDNKKTYYNFNAGIVLGNTLIEIDGGHVVHNVYGGGAMGSVGTYTLVDEAYNTAHPEATLPIGKPISCAANTGTCTVTVSGGQIGVSGATMAGHGKGGPDDFGHVFGAGRGEMHDPKLYPNVETCAYFNKTILNISGTAFLTGSAYGGSESGHVLGDTEVNISGGQIGCGKNTDEPFADAVWVDGYTPTESLDCASWPFAAPFAPYDPYANATGNLDEYSNGESTEGGRLEASDGHTYYGNVFGGGSGSIPYFDETEGISKYLSTAGSVEGTTTVNISGGHILTNVYGGCEATNVKGSATITMTGGTVGVPRTVAQIVAHPLTGYIFGAGKGDQRIFFNKETNVDRTFVNIEGGRVYGSIFGGGEDGHVFQNTTVNIGKDNDTTEGPTIGTTGTSYVDGNVFGGGRGFGGEALTAGNIGGSVELNIKSGKILGSVYGGGRLASVGYGLYLVDEEITEGEGKVKPYGILRPDDQYDGSYPNPSTQEASAYYDKGRGYITINISGGIIGNDAEYIYNPTDEQKAAIPKTTFDSQNQLQYTKGGNVFTGGMGRLYALDNTTLLPLWPKLGKCKGTTLNMTGGTVKSSIYGGGEIGAVAEDATVNVNGGTVGTKVVDSEDANKYYYFGSVFGGGKGGVDNITYPSTTPAEEQIPISEAGTTGGNVEVNLNKTVASDEAAKGAIVSQVFGCNDMNGSPKGNVTVHIYATQNADKENISTKYDKGSEKFDVMAVYGGGNLAAYEPTSSTGSTKVIIDGCELTSIKQVYGGGNAASTPATQVDINETYEIDEAFGGGNGKDKLPNGDPNPGANVGYTDYSAYETSTDENKGAATKDLRIANYQYGSGEARMNIHGGTVHRVYGGSNTKGNVRITAVTMLEDESGCPFEVEEAYGGGKSAPMDATSSLEMACIPGLSAAYGGAEDAQIEGDVNLTITNGTFDRVFGGNNVSGEIKGTITVNIEETGCKPIIIGQLYGGGNQAPYTAPDGKPGPTVNVRSFTSIGDIYGGGYGAPAKVVADTYVNINVGDGRYKNGFTYKDGKTVNDYIGEKQITFKEYERKYNSTTGKWDFVYDENGTRKLVSPDPSITITLPSKSLPSKIGAIQNVYGGGNAAEVDGDTYVNIGTNIDDAPQYTIIDVKTGESVEDFFTKGEDGKYNKASGTAVEGTNYYMEYKPTGVDIRGNVYGGGNNAEVTGDTHVTIGKAATATP